MAHVLPEAKQEETLRILEERFKENMNRHPHQDWESVETKLRVQPSNILILCEMERTGGEPDVIGNDVVFMDCSAESPKGRRSICYDRPALEGHTKNKPEMDAQTLALEIGIEILTEEEYRYLQSFGAFDLKSSSWIQTPEKIRSLGGALFCDRRYDTVFTYHNGADSYYSVRGFRGKLLIEGD